MGNTGTKSNPSASSVDRKRTTKRNMVKGKTEDGTPAWSPMGKSYIDMDIPEERG